jgi:fructose-1,6-bisphosphatase I
MVGQRTKKLYTIDRFISEQQWMYPGATGEFTSLLHDLTFAIRIISSEVRRAGLNDILGMTANINVHGDVVRKIDEFANDVIYRAMDHSGHLCAMISEESEEVIKIPKEFKKGKYILAFDPLDGSSNIDVNITIGSIFSLYMRNDPDPNEEPIAGDLLQPGNRLKAAIYVLYGSSTILAFTTGNGVNIFTFDPHIGEFLLTSERLKMPSFGWYYSCNEAYSKRWDKNIRQYLDYLKMSSLYRTEPYKMRYTATSVADIHRTLHYGGIYLYPSEKNLPEGKIRLLYEANPLSFIVEQAGGRATNGYRRILDIEPTSIHQTTPIIIGSKNNVLEAEKFIKGRHTYQKNRNRIS